jgi:hypothetical protein
MTDRLIVRRGYICKPQINVQPLIDVQLVQSSNPFLISTQQTYVPQIDVFFSSFFPLQMIKSAFDSQIYVLFQILKSMAVSHFLKPTSNDVTDVWYNTTQ